ncbi:MAG: hypothetical protein ACPGVT_02835, partial [Maricaulaceae bacterium]
TTKNLQAHKRGAWTRFIRQQAEQQDMAWCYWGWIGEFKAWDLKRDNWIPPIINALTWNDE